MAAASVRLKRAVQNVCSEATQRRLRRTYVTVRVLTNAGKREREIGALPSLVGPGDRVADVGANVGIYTKALSELVGPCGRVYSFEPIADNYEILCAVVRRGSLSNVDTFRFALGSTARQGEMVVPRAGGFGGYYRAHVARQRDEGRRESVAIQTLDSLYRSGTLASVDLIKCDVEGTEYDVLLGAGTLIAEQRPSGVVELSRRTSERVFSFFHGLGYRGFVFDRGFSPVGSYQDRKFSKYVFVHPSRRTPVPLFNSVNEPP
jgi:FkbM family methyltransferase